MPSDTSIPNLEAFLGDGMETRDTKDIKKCRLDHCLMMPNLTDQLINGNYQYTTASDHASIIIKLGKDADEYGKGTFRAPSNIQNDPIYAKLVRQCIRDTLLDNKTPNEETIYLGIALSPKEKLKPDTLYITTS